MLFKNRSSIEERQPDLAEYRFPLDEEANEMLHALGLPERVMREITYIPLSFSFRFPAPIGYGRSHISRELAGTYSQARVKDDSIDLSFPCQIVDHRGGNGLVSLTFRYEPEQGALVAAGHVIELDQAEEATILWLSQRDPSTELFTTI